MKENPLQPESNAVQSRIILSPEIDRAETEAIDAARDLRAILEEEAHILKRFAAAELLRLIPRKEFSVSELSGRLQAVKGPDGNIAGMSEQLKELLKAVHALNLSNRHFIESSLSHWQDLLSVLYPSGYGPSAEETRGAHTPKGLAFSREA